MIIVGRPLFLIIFIFSLILFVLLGVAHVYTVNSNERHLVVTVTGKEVKASSETSYYLIFTDKGVFQCTDNILKGKFNSSDVYGMMVEGKTYNIRVVGIRHRGLSMYPNILNAAEID